MTNKQIKNKLIEAGLKNLHDFGYEYATKENILTDEIYSKFFKSMLYDNLGHDDKIDIAINELLTVI